MPAANGRRFAYRDPAFAYPDVWFRLTRAGNSSTAFYGANGIDWTQIGDQFTPESPYPGTVSVGLATASISAAARTTAHYRNLSYAAQQTAELAIVREGGNVVISWPQDSAGFSLYTSPDLRSWQPVPAAPVLASGR